MSSTPSRKKRGAKARRAYNTRPDAKAEVSNEKLIARLKRLKAAPIDPKLLEVIVGKRALTDKEAVAIGAQIEALLADAGRVTRTRDHLAQVPSLVMAGSVLL